MHVATDGESYGHHHKYGEMALAYTLKLLEQDKTVKLTNYASYLEQFPPEYEAEIVEDTSWSCVHGVERWRSDCGCNGGKPGFNQAWRAPLRQAFDELRDAVAPLTEREGAALFNDVWAARDGYIQVVLDRSDESDRTAFSARTRATPLNEPERARALELMEMQRHTQLMYTSCGWFFDDISGIETVQIDRLRRAHAATGAGAFWFGRGCTGAEVSGAPGRGPLQCRHCRRWRAHLRRQRSLNGAGTGASGGPLRHQLHLFSFAEETDLYCYHVRRISHEIHTSGRGRLALGRAHISSAITGEARSFSFAVLHFGDQNITAAVKAYQDFDAAAFEAFAAQAAALVERASFPDVIRLLDRYYGHVDYSLISLFRDEQRRIIQLILNSTLWDIETSLTTIYEDHANLLHYLSQSGLPKPSALTLAAGFAINAGLRRALEADPIDQALLRSFLQLAKADQVAARNAFALLPGRPAHEARHDRVANVLGIVRASRPSARHGQGRDRTAIRSEPVAGAEHLV